MTRKSPRTKLQYGLHCTNCGDDIFSNSDHDFVECSCGWWFADGGFGRFRSGGPGMDITEPTFVTRTVSDPDSLPWRYRLEVPAKPASEVEA